MLTAAVEILIYDEAGYGGYIDDAAAPLLDHHLADFSGNQEGATDVGVNDEPKFIERRRLRRLIDTHGTCVVDQNVDTAYLTNCPLHEAPDIFCTGDICPDRENALPSSAIFSAAFLTTSSLLPQMTTKAPALWKRLAIVKPMPVPPPVIMAV